MKRIITTICLCTFLIILSFTGVNDMKAIKSHYLNDPPYPPSNPNPPDGATDVNVNILLSWTGGDPDGDPVVYDVYFGTDPNPPNVVMGQSGTTYDPGKLNYNTKYYWRIDAWDSYGYSTTGDTWTFTTEILVNNPPAAPTISGPTEGKIRTEYEYTFVATDPDGDDVYYWIQWGEGCPVVEWIGPYASGEEVTLTNSWDTKGTYTIKAQAKDVHDATSEWGMLEVSMPKTFSLNIKRLHEKLSEWFILTFGREILPHILNR